MAGFLSVWLFRLNSRRYRRILIACAATLGISGSLLASIVFVRWQSERAIRGDIGITATRVSEQLLRSLTSRRGTLTLMRGTLDKASTMTLADQRALANSAAAHTNHLSGVGLLRQGQPITWWVVPPKLPPRELSALAKVMSQRTAARSAWRVPSTFVTRPSPDRPTLVMLEPLRSSPSGPSAIIGIFDLQRLLGDFFEVSVQQPHPVKLLDESDVLYASPSWQAPSGDQAPRSVERPMRLDALKWTIVMQPGRTKAAQTLSAFHMLLIGISALAGASMIGLIWLLVLRTAILQRAVSRRTEALRRMAERLRRLAITDELTGLFNRRYFLEHWAWEYDRAKRYRRPLGCLMIDVDKFKHINDRLGHPVGDLLLKQVAEELKHQLRQSDILARLGGDEFIVALPETSNSQAAAVAEKLRELRIAGAWSDDALLGPVSLSVGVSHVEDAASSEQVIKLADANLYALRHAASAGRDTRVAAGSASVPH